MEEISTNITHVYIHLLTTLIQIIDFRIGEPFYVDVPVGVVLGFGGRKKLAYCNK